METTIAFKKSPFILEDKSDFQMINNLSVAFYWHHFQETGIVVKKIVF